MTGQHFREVLEITCKTTGCSKSEIARIIGVIPNTLISVWQKKGVPKSITPYVMSVLRSMVRGEIHANTNTL